MIHILLGPAEFDARIPDRERCVLWQDDLSFGPVPATDTLEGLTRIRETFWGSFSSGMLSDHQHTPAASSLSQRDEQLRRLIESQEEVVLWCGPNRREILMFCAVLHFFGVTALQETSLAPCPRWGALSCNSEQLARSFNDRSPVLPELVQLSVELWGQYTNPEPLGFNKLLNRLLQEHHPLETVVRWILEGYPSTTNGLSRVEEAILRNATEADSILRIVGRTMGKSEDTISDTELYEKVREFLKAKVPVLELANGGKDSIERGPLQDFRRLTVRPTSLALELLNSKSDYVAVDGIDRWIGGVHLLGHTVPWRFDSSAGHLVAANG